MNSGYKNLIYYFDKIMEDEEIVKSLSTNDFMNYAPKITKDKKYIYDKLLSTPYVTLSLDLLHIICLNNDEDDLSDVVFSLIDNQYYDNKIVKYEYTFNYNVYMGIIIMNLSFSKYNIGTVYGIIERIEDEELKENFDV